MRVLYVEDSESLRRTVRRALVHAGHAVDVAADGESGLEAAELNDYEVIVLDVMMPKLDGLALLKHLRAARKNVHVLLLTARDTVEDRVTGLREGADDYLVKPFALEELLARVDALGRRLRGDKSSLLELGPMTVDFHKKKLALDGKDIDLTPREWRLFECLVHRRGQVVSRTEIEERIYDERVEPMSNVVDTAVYGLRRKLGRDCIHTRRGLGYVLEVPAS
ncbi:response regulator transcription factor [Luteolibacter sp. LG18]|uniref:response regulator transcription factor n=1 Tax=Luteolibacter sp. LG18 TaxID=2819286 RepID=UPI0030C76ACC